jgi:hypothetical protein
MAVLVGGLYMAVTLLVFSFVTEVLVPKVTRKNCNDSVDPLWPVK